MAKENLTFLDENNEYCQEVFITKKQHQIAHNYLVEAGKFSCNCTKKSSSCRYTFIHFVIITFLILVNSSTSAAAYFRNMWDTDNEDSNFRFSRNRSKYEICLNGEYLKDYTVYDGRDAGEYINLGEVDSFTECAELCCQDSKCYLALMLTSPLSGDKNCFKINCYAEETCKPKSAKHSKYNPHLFKRGSDAEKPVKGR